MKAYFPKLDLGKVDFNTAARLPGNWFTCADKVSAMTLDIKFTLRVRTFRRAEQH